ncbi:preATP grasp domain-containing protein [Streptomyces litchfieldiae]|uniref:Peptide ligase PGM1-related protein n=1 Tax=Streptomyces litchfieldiae TaxID=3075543 RepID=A0ABU2MV98_9ACTN|nr:peptide ligase PGM1-related protein [Streptomyces sp. DSM 44938]MDT0345445.1 peptide ligase PGM1-related protein [Streptomyces sp. DSM 44938]
MTRLLVANDFIEDQAFVADARLKKTGWWAQRMVWFARDGDVLVMTTRPEDAYLDYVTSLTGTRLATLRVVVPPPGRLGSGVLTADRLADAGFRARLRAELDGRAVDQVLSLHPDPAVVDLARFLGAEHALAGHGFIAQGGGSLANSKVVFRAIAGGVGVPLPDGGVCGTRPGAEELITTMLADGPLMLKHDLRSGGRGNEVLSPVPGVDPVGAQRTVVLPDRAAVREYLAERWDWLTGHGQGRFVVERYFPGSQAVFAEFSLTDDGITFAGQGEMVSAPMAKAEIIPAPGLKPDTVAALLEGGEQLCRPLHAMGYRGLLSADAIVTPDQELYFTEYNGRITGSTHIYEIVGRHIVGPDYAENRVLLEIDGWQVPSFQEGVDLLRTSGLGYDRTTRTGVMLVMAFNPSVDSIRYVVVARNLDSAYEQARELEALTGTSPDSPAPDRTSSPPPPPPSGSERRA